MLAFPAAPITRPSRTTSAPVGPSPRPPAARASTRARPIHRRSASTVSPRVSGSSADTKRADAGTPGAGVRRGLLLLAPRLAATGLAGLPLAGLGIAAAL